MAELSFTNEGSKYVCEFEVSSDFNLHLERDKGGFLFLYQRSSDGGSYDSVGDAKFAPHDSIIDYDCTALVYPKFIKIVSEVEPTYAAVVSDGEVTEIKSQSKEIEVTANGTTVIEPDAGFAYLNKVSVKTNVEGQGGGSGVVYKKGNVTQVMTVAALVRAEKDGDVVIVPPISLAQFQDYTPVAIGFHSTDTIIMQGMTLNMGEMLDMTIAQLGLELTQITEEEFYAL